MSGKTQIRVALDWTPNTIHTGLFVALEKDFYADKNLDVRLLSPDASYTTTPAKRLEHNEVDLVICPSESCIAYQEMGKMKLQAVYAILQKDASAIVSTKYSRVADLGDHRATYGSYNAKYEDHIIMAMVSRDGGDGKAMKIQSSAGKLDLFDELKRGSIDATWVFMPWEGVDADMEDIKLHQFKPEDHGVPYGYSPVIARNAASETISDDVLKRFVDATRQGYRFAMESVSDSIDILGKHCQPSRSAEFLEQSQNAINRFYGEKAYLGEMSALRWKQWVDWLKKQELLTQRHVEVDELYCDAFGF